MTNLYEYVYFRIILMLRGLIVELEKMFEEAKQLAMVKYSDDSFYDANGNVLSERVHDWRNHVPEEFKRDWAHFSERERKLIFIMAVEAASNEEWD